MNEAILYNTLCTCLTVIEVDAGILENKLSVIDFFCRNLCSSIIKKRKVFSFNDPLFTFFHNLKYIWMKHVQQRFYVQSLNEWFVMTLKLLLRELLSYNSCCTNFPEMQSKLVSSLNESSDCWMNQLVGFSHQSHTEN